MMKKFNKINIFVFSFLILFVFYPVFTMLIKIDWLDFKYLLSSLISSPFNGFVETVIEDDVSITLLDVVLYDSNNLSKVVFFCILVKLLIIITTTKIKMFKITIKDPLGSSKT